MTGKKIIDTGLVEFILPFDRGEEKIYFNPNEAFYNKKLKIFRLFLTIA